MKLYYRLFGMLFLFVAVYLHAVPVYAMDFRSSETTVTVAEDELIVGTLFAAGNAIDINGSVDGDVICAGQTISIHGSVSGDVICAGQAIRIDGVVGGSIRIVGQTIDVDGPVDRNGMFFGQTITFGKESDIAGDVIFGGQTISTLGDVGKSLVGAGNDIRVDGGVAGDAKIFGNTITVGETGVIGGTMTYESDRDASIAQGAQVGNLVKQPMRKEFKDMNKQRSEGMVKQGKLWPMNAVGSLLTSLVLGCIAVLLFQSQILSIVRIMKEHTAASFGHGLLWMVVFPVLFILLCVTIIGIPFAILYAMIFVFVLWIAKLFTAVFIGKEVIQSFWKTKQLNWYAAVFVGVILTELVFHMPYIGGLTAFLATLWGTGGLIKNIVAHRSSAKSVK